VTAAPSRAAGSADLPRRWSTPAEHRSASTSTTVIITWVEFKYREKKSFLHVALDTTDDFYNYASMQTVGRDKLLKWLEADSTRSRTQVARALGISQPAVSNWLRGVSRPEHMHRVALERLCGVPAGDWDTDEERARHAQLAALAPLTGTDA
jgi:hypothetical protein